MKFLAVVKKGKAQFHPEGLRCAAPRDNRPGWICNKLIVRKNSDGLIAGEFKCERCSQLIEIKLKPVAASEEKQAAA